MEQRHTKMIEKAAENLIAVADDTGRDLVEVIAEMERFIVQGTKVGDAASKSVEPGRRGYTLEHGRLVSLSPVTT